MWARIDDAKCAEFVSWNPAGLYPVETTWVKVPLELIPYVNRVQLGVTDGVVAPVSLDDLKTAKLADIKTACETALAPLDAAYPEREVKSWPQQISEATLVGADPTLADPPPDPMPEGWTDTIPLLRTMAAERPSLSPDGTAADLIIELARRILANAAAWSAVAGPIIGKRQAAEDAIDNATTLAEVLAVTVDFTTTAAEEAA